MSSSSSATLSTASSLRLPSVEVSPSNTAVQSINRENRYEAILKIIKEKTPFPDEISLLTCDFTVAMEAISYRSLSSAESPLLKAAEILPDGALKPFILMNYGDRPKLLKWELFVCFKNLVYAKKTESIKQLFSDTLIFDLNQIRSIRSGVCLIDIMDSDYFDDLFAIGDLETIKKVLQKKNFSLNKNHYFLAIKSGNLELVQYLEAKIFDIRWNDQEFERRSTLLHAASLSNSLTIFYYIVEKFSIDLSKNINIQDEYGRSAAFVVAQYGTASMLEFLQNQGADFSMKDSNGDTIFHAAAGNKDPKIMKYLYSLNFLKSNCINARGETPLAVAADHGCFETIKLLVENINVDANVRKTRLSDAVKKAIRRFEDSPEQNFKILKYLIDQGGKDAGILHVAALFGRVDVIKYLEEKDVSLSSVIELQHSYVSYVSSEVREYLARKEKEYERQNRKSRCKCISAICLGVIASACILITGFKLRR